MFLMLLTAVVWVACVRAQSCASQTSVFIGKQYDGAPPFLDYFCYGEAQPELVRGLEVATLNVTECTDVVGTAVQECSAIIKTQYLATRLSTGETRLRRGQPIFIKPRVGTRMDNNTLYTASFECPSRVAEGQTPRCVVPACPVTSPDVYKKTALLSEETVALLDSLADGTLCQKLLNTLFRVSLATLLGLLMLGMGAGVTLKDIREIVVTRRPWPFVIGLSAQYVLMPLLAFAFAYVFQFTHAQAVGIILTGCTSGGTTSQLFTKLAGGDMALSIVMTSVSTILAFAMLPLLTKVYTLPFVTSVSDGDGSGTIALPFKDILLALLLVLVPALAGMAIRAKFGPRVGKILERIGTACGVIGIVAAVTLGIMLNKKAFDARWGMWTAAVLLAFAGALFGYLCSCLARLSNRHRRTVAIEVGIQNSSLTITIIALSYSGTVQAEILQFPLLYSVWLLIDGAVLVVLFKLMNLCKACRVEPLDDLIMEDMGVAKCAKCHAAPGTIEVKGSGGGKTRRLCGDCVVKAADGDSSSASASGPAADSPSASPTKSSGADTAAAKDDGVAGAGVDEEYSETSGGGSKVTKKKKRRTKTQEELAEADLDP